MRVARAVVPLLVALAGLATPSGAASPASDCTGKALRGAVGSFVSAFNRGDYDRLDSLFAAEPDFEWYSSAPPGQRLSREARRRGTLLSYFKARHRKGDRFDLVSFRFNGNSPRYGNFEARMRRSVLDFEDGGWFGLIGKGAAICSGGSVQFIVMTYGGPAPATGQARS